MFNTKFSLLHKLKVERDNIFYEEIKDIISIIKSGNFHKIQLYLSNKPFLDLNVKDESGECVLSALILSEEITSEDKKVLILSKLLNHNVDLLLTNGLGQNILHNTYEKKYVKILKFIKENGESVLDEMLFTTDIYNKLPTEYLFTVDLNKSILPHQILQNRKLVSSTTSSITVLKDKIDEIIAKINSNTTYIALISVVEEINKHSYLRVFQNILGSIEKKISLDSLQTEEGEHKLYTDLRRKVSRVFKNLTINPKYKLFETNGYDPNFNKQLYLEESKKAMSKVIKVKNATFNTDVCMLETVRNNIIFYKSPSLDIKLIDFDLNITSKYAIFPRDHLLFGNYFVQNVKYLNYVQLVLPTPSDFWSDLATLLGLAVNDVDGTNDYFTSATINERQKILLVTLHSIMKKESILENLEKLIFNPASYYTEELKYLIKRLTVVNYTEKEFFWYTILRFSNFLTPIPQNTTLNYIHSGSLFYNESVLTNPNYIEQANDVVEHFNFNYKAIVDTVLSGDLVGYGQRVDKLNIKTVFYGSPRSNLNDILIHPLFNTIVDISKFTNVPTETVQFSAQDLFLKQFDENVEYKDTLRLLYTFFLKNSNNPTTAYTQNEIKRLSISLLDFKVVDNILNNAILGGINPNDSTNNMASFLNILENIIELNNTIQDDSFYVYEFIKQILETRKIPSIKDQNFMSDDIFYTLTKLYLCTSDTTYAISYSLEVLGLNSSLVRVVTNMYEILVRGIPTSIMTVFTYNIIALCQDKEYIGFSPVLNNQRATSSKPDEVLYFDYGLNNWNTGKHTDFIHNINESEKCYLFGRIDSLYLVLIKKVRLLLSRFNNEINYIQSSLQTKRYYPSFREMGVRNIQQIIQELSLITPLLSNENEDLILQTNILQNILSTSFLIDARPQINGTDSVNETLSEVYKWFNKQKIIIKEIEKLQLIEDLDKLFELISIQDDIQYEQEKKNSYLLPLDTTSSNIIVLGDSDIYSNFVTVVNKTRNTMNRTTPLSSGEFTLGLMKESIVYDVVQSYTDNSEKMTNYLITSEILNDYLSYAITLELKEMIKEKYNQLGGAITDMTFKPKMIISFDKLHKLFEKCNASKYSEMLYILSCDYLSFSDQWDYEKSYYFIDNETTKLLVDDVNKLLIKNPTTGKDSIELIIQNQNFIILEYLFTTFSTIKNVTYHKTATEILKTYLSEDELKSVIIKTFYNDTCNYLDNNILVGLSDAYKSILDELERNITFSNVLDDYYTISSEHCILKRDSDLYTEFIKILKVVVVFLIDGFYTSCQELVSDIYDTIKINKPTSEFIDEIANDLISVILNYPKEDSSKTMKSCLNKLKLSLKLVSADVDEKITEQIIPYFDKLFRRVLTDFRSMHSNYIRYKINRAITEKIIDLTK